MARNHDNDIRAVQIIKAFWWDLAVILDGLRQPQSGAHSRLALVSVCESGAQTHHPERGALITGTSYRSVRNQDAARNLSVDASLVVHVRVIAGFAATKSSARAVPIHRVSSVCCRIQFRLPEAEGTRRRRELVEEGRGGRRGLRYATLLDDVAPQEHQVTNTLGCAIATACSEEFLRQKPNHKRFCQCDAYGVAPPPSPSPQTRPLRCSTAMSSPPQFQVVSQPYPGRTPLASSSPLSHTTGEVQERQEAAPKKKVAFTASEDKRSRPPTSASQVLKLTGAPRR